MLAEIKLKYSQLSLSSFSPQQADTLIIKIKTDLPAQKLKGYFGRQEIRFTKIGENLVAILGISFKEKSGKYKLNA